jgi:hypothetical protein
MKKTSTILLTTLFVLSFALSSGVFAQTIFSDDFESGTADPGWGVFYANEDELTAVPMSTAPDVLPNGGDYIGWIQDIDNSYTGSAVAMRGDFSLSNYSIAGDVYCYVNNSGGSAYTGLVVYADSNNHDFYKLRADFDNSDRINFSGLRSDTVTFQPLYNHNFLGSENTGLFPTTDGWHKMKVEVKTLNADSTAFWCYFDDQLLFGCPIYDTTSTRNLSGAYGLYTFQMDGDGIPGYFDNIVVTSLVTSIDNNSNVLPQNYFLAQNYPNPFNPETQIGYQLASGSFVTLAVYDLLGREIKVLVNEAQPSGGYLVNWNGTDSFGNKVSSGIYMYTLRTSNSILSKKMVLMK